MYEVIQEFVDLHDNDHHYYVGDPFPRDGIKVTKKRIKELATSDNKQGVPLIAEVVFEEDVPADEPEQEE